jgi:RNA polymerase sigma-70 factor, ECF subfamily
MDRYAAGDDAAFAEVYDALAPRLLAYLLRRSTNVEDAADLLQQTMLHLHRARRHFIAGAAVAPWAFSIARRLVVDSRRRRSRSEAREAADRDKLEVRASDSPRADEIIHAREMTLRVVHALSQLPPLQRAAFELIRSDGLTLSQAAQILGTTVGAAKLRVHRADEALREALSAEDRPATLGRAPLSPFAVRGRHPSQRQEPVGRGQRQA